MHCYLKDIDTLFNSCDIISDIDLKNEEKEIIRKKIKALARKGRNDNIFTATRGEGRRERIQGILTGEYFFNWGIKSEYLYMNEVNYTYDERQYLLEELVDNVVRILKYYQEQQNRLNLSVPNEGIRGLEEYLCKEISNISSEIEYIEIRDFICVILHLLNTYDNDYVHNHKYFISSQWGFYRYDRCINFAAHINGGKIYNCILDKIADYYQMEDSNKEYVLIDYWIKKEYINGICYRATKVFELFNLYNIKWFNKIIKANDYELISKGCIFPNHIIGYFYINQGKVQHYYINPYIVRSIRTNSSYNIGEHFYVNQNVKQIKDFIRLKAIYSSEEIDAFRRINLE